MKISELKIGENLDIRQVLNTALKIEDINGSGEPFYKSRIYEITSDKLIEVDIPSHEGKLILPEVGDTYEVVVYTQVGLYRLMGKVKRRYRIGMIALMTLQVLTEPERFQRREYFRHSCMMGVQYLPLFDYETELETRQMTPASKLMWQHKREHPESTEKQGLVLDLSGGGVRFTTTEKFEVGSSLLFRLYLKNDNMDESFVILGQILDEKRLPEAGKREYRVEFQMEDDDIRESIIKYIFDEERKRRKKV
ncbi:hypothetical protein FACS1894111_02610 [Clostridia bacterium]|nr:hypothetical protein FACS1894111_02610 [Clostridia bacterium]